MPDNRLLDDVVAQMQRGDDTDTALFRVRQNLKDDIAARVWQGEGLESAVVGAGAPVRLATPIRQMAIQFGGGDTPSVLVGAVHMVVGGSGSVDGIPTASCLHRHLPPNRPPTAAEIMEAWRKCQLDPRS